MSQPVSRTYDCLLSEHIREDRQMVFLMGPRQVGKTTTARSLAGTRPGHRYLNWDNMGDRGRILAGPDAVAEHLGLFRLLPEPPVCIFDELHKFGRWKTFLKGLFDKYSESMRIIVTGSARLDVFRAGGDSLMGRYFGYRMHPFSVAEIVAPGPRDSLLRREPRCIAAEDWAALTRYGGFPEPFVRRDPRFWRRWCRLRSRQLLTEDLRDLTRIQELGQVEILAELLRQRVGQLVSYSTLSREIGATVDSVRRWLQTLGALYYCFPVRPWFENVSRALRKEPKYYLWDWSLAQTPGAVAENLVACALLKAVHYWTDRGDGDFDLYFVRDKEKHEVDFLVSRDGQPWFLAEVKSSTSPPLSPSLQRFREQTGASHAFQVVMDLPFVARDCFEVNRPTIVPARTFLAQLV